MKPLRPVDAQFPMIQGWNANPQNYPKNGGHKGYDYSCPVGTEDGACIPFDTMNRDFRDFLEWNDRQENPLDWHTKIIMGSKDEK
jgi:hypothetical protein